MRNVVGTRLTPDRGQTPFDRGSEGPQHDGEGRRDGRAAWPERAPEVRSEPLYAGRGPAPNPRHAGLQGGLVRVARHRGQS